MRQIARIAGGESIIVGCTAYGLPFTPSAAFAVIGDRLYSATGQLHDIQVRVVPSERVVMTIRTESEGRRVTAAIIKGSEGANRARVGPVLAAERPRRPPPELPYPTVLPALDQLRRDSTGHLWVRLYALPQDTTLQWWIYDIRGRLVATAAWPSRLRVTEIGPDYVLGVWRDDNDVETVRMFPLERRPSGDRTMDRQRD